jgi:heptosyltransferase-3
LRVLIIRPAALGDTLMLVPPLAQMRDSAEVVLVGRSPALEFLRPYVEQCVNYESPGWHGLFLDTFDGRLSSTIPRADGVVAFLSDPDGVVEKNLIACLPGRSVSLFPPFPSKGAKIHVAVYLAECLEQAGLPVNPEEAFEAACHRALLESESPTIRQKRIVFHPGSGGKGKNHSPDFWRELVHASKKDPLLSGHRVVVLLGPAEERIYPFFTENLIREDAQILFSPEKEHLVSLLTKASLYMGHDSGITHLAAMLGTPTIALFKKSSVYQWAPLGPVVRVIKSDESSSGLIGKVLEAALQMI